MYSPFRVPLVANQPDRIFPDVLVIGPIEPTPAIFSLHLSLSSRSFLHSCSLQVSRSRSCQKLFKKGQNSRPFLSITYRFRFHSFSLLPKYLLYFHTLHKN